MGKLFKGFGPFFGCIRIDEFSLEVSVRFVSVGRYVCCLTGILASRRLLRFMNVKRNKRLDVFSKGCLSVVENVQSIFRNGASGVGSDIRSKLTIVAMTANVPANSNDARVVWAGKSVNIIAASTAPKV
jgi:hypothetical protein